MNVPQVTWERPWSVPYKYTWPWAFRELIVSAHPYSEEYMLFQSTCVCLQASDLQGFRTKRRRILPKPRCCQVFPSTRYQQARQLT